jgi:hypothetical protein
MLPRTRKQYKEHQDLVKLLQSGTAFNHCHKPPVAEPHQVRLFRCDRHSQNIPVDPKAGEIDLVREPVRGAGHCGERLDQVRKIPPQDMKNIGDDGEKGDIYNKTIRAEIILSQEAVISSDHKGPISGKCRSIFRSGLSCNTLIN